MCNYGHFLICLKSSRIVLRPLLGDSLSVVIIDGGYIRACLNLSFEDFNKKSLITSDQIINCCDWHYCFTVNL